ncbi:hypothetical protein JYT16_02145 [Gemmatimonas aurantiaca]|nr:hypothetical protein [Gemmatimonas aurantiaca]
MTISSIVIINLATPVLASDENITTDSSEVALQKTNEFDWLLGGPVSKPALSYSIGVSYDYLSQTFYLLDTVIDTLETSIRLNQEYLNQPAFFSEVRFRPFRDESLRFTAYAERSEEFFRSRLESTFKTNNPDKQLSGNVTFDGRMRNAGELEFGDEYGLVRGRLKFRSALSKRTRGYVSLSGEAHRLGATPDDETSSIYTGNYEKAGAELGLVFDIGQLDRLNFSLGAQRRTVKDRMDLNYRLSRFRADYSGFTDASFYALEFYFENRDYDSTGDNNDQRQFVLNGMGEYRFNTKLSLVGDFRVETINYLQDTLSYNIDQTLADVDVKFVRRWGLTSLGLGFGFSQLSQKDQTSTPIADLTDVTGGSSSLSEEYSERAALLSFEYFKLSGIMLTIENQWGFRDMVIESEYQSDYWFDRITVFSSLNITKSLKLNLIGSCDFEWHDQDNDDNSLYLLNSSFSYNFN